MRARVDDHPDPAMPEAMQRIEGHWHSSSAIHRDTWQRLGLADAVQTETLDAGAIFAEPFRRRHDEDAIKPLDSRPVRRFFGYAVY